MGAKIHMAQQQILIMEPNKKVNPISAGTQGIAKRKATLRRKSWGNNGPSGQCWDIMWANIHMTHIT